MITTSDLSYGPDADHDRREEPRLGCGCRACYCAREEHVEEALKKLYETESGFRYDISKLDEVKLPIVRQALPHYLYGAVSYEDMKTALIGQLWTLVQEHHKADVHRLRLTPMSVIIRDKPKES